MKTKILRITRHEVSGKQIVALKRIFGDVEITEVSETLSMDVREAVSRFDNLADGFEIVEAVLPIQIVSAVLKFSKFSKRGGRLIRAVMNRELLEDGSAVFTFDHYEETLKVEVVTKAL